MQDQHFRRVALFFFFAFLDEPLSLRASRRASMDLGSAISSGDAGSKIVYVTRKVWDRFRQKVTRGRYRVTGGKGWIPPESVDLTVWKEFQKTADDDELLAVIWSHILGISEDDISKGLGVTKGTVRYRTARGLRKIGMLTRGEVDGYRL